MIEELARAAWAENMRLVSLVDEAGGYCLPWDDETDGLREDWRSLIRAILKRLRNPTDEMLEAGFEDYPSIWTAAITPEDREGIWQAMIDSILEPEEASEQSTPLD